MRVRACVLLPVLVAFAIEAQGQTSVAPQKVTVPSGSLKLGALFWHPEGTGPFPAVLFNHGSGASPERQSAQAAAIGPVFARHGYALLFLFRRGSGLSANQGISAADAMARTLAKNGQAAGNKTQMRLLEKDHLSDALAGLAWLRARSDVDPNRIAVAGHSFGGSITLLMAERDSRIRAALDFGGAANSWEASPELRARLLKAIRRASAPIFFIQAANDYSVAPTKVMDAEMSRLDRPHSARIYPAEGQTPEEGHDFIFRRVDLWEPDVFAFLQKHVKP
jgi:dienelactone hydrolase